MAASVAKSDVLSALQQALRARLHRAQAAVAEAFDAATHEQSRAENKYDTRALEQSYLSAGQTARVEALRRQLTALHHYALPDAPLDQVGPGALVEVVLSDAKGEQQRTLLIVPFDVAETVEVGEVGEVGSTTVHVVAAAAPLAKALRGREAEDEVRFGPRVAYVASVR